MSQKITAKSFFANFKRILAYFSNYKSEIVLLSVLGVLSAIGNGSIPLITGRFFDSLIKPSTIHGWPSYAVWLTIWLVSQIIIFFIDWKNNLRSRHLSEEIERDFIVSGFTKLLTFPMSFHKKNKIGAITSQITRTANNMWNFNDSVLLRLAPQFLSIIVALILSFYLNPILASILTAGIILYILIAIPTMKPLGEVYRKMQSAYSHAYAVSHEAVNNVQSVKQFTTEDYEFKKITAAHGKAKTLLRIFGSV